MKIKTSELIGPALDWAVAMAIGLPMELPMELTDDERFSTDPAQGQPILERIKIHITYWGRVDTGTWYAWPTNPEATVPDDYYGQNEFEADGPTMLIAGMRCFVMMNLGDEVEVPDTLT